MRNDALLESVTDLLSKEADTLLALVNFYGLVIVAVIGWVVNTGKDGPGISWFRVIVFNLCFLAFFAASFAGFWYLYDRIEITAGLWRDLAADSGATNRDSVERIVWLPPRDWLWGLWGFNVLVLLLVTVLLRKGGYGRAEAA
jgi:hypothetical protein